MFYIVLTLLDFYYNIWNFGRFVVMIFGHFLYLPNKFSRTNEVFLGSFFLVSYRVNLSFIVLNFEFWSVKFLM